MNESRRYVSSRISIAVFVVTLATLIGVPVSTVKADLSAKQREWLTEFDPILAAEIAQHADKFQEWKTRIEQVQRDLRSIGANASNANRDPKKILDLVVEIASFLETLSLNSPKLDEFVSFTREIKPILQKLEHIKRIAYDPAQELDISEEQFRKEAERLVKVAVAGQLVKRLGGGVLDKIDQLRDPAKFARNFLEETIKKKYFNKPYTVGKFTFTFIQAEVDQSKSLFSDQAKIGVWIEYQGGIKAKATGIYFKYRGDNKLPEPVLHRIRIDENALKQQFVGEALNALGKELLPDSGLPISVSDIRFLGFAGGGGNRPGGISFDVAVKFSDSLPAIEGDDIVIYPDGHIDLKKIALESKVRIPLGATGLAIEEIGIAYAPNGDNEDPPTISGHMLISTVGSSRLYALKLTVTIALPFNFIELKGDVVLLDGNLSVAWVEFKLDFRDGSFSGSYEMPSSEMKSIPVAYNMLASKGKFRLDGKGFVASGDLKMYGQDVLGVEMEFLFNGHGRIEANAYLFGKKLKSDFSAGYTPGFKDVWVKVDTMITGVSVKPWGSLDVHVTVSTDEKGLISVRARAGDIRISVDNIPGLYVLTFNWLVKQLEKEGVKAYHRMLDNMADAEKDGRDWAAEQDRKARDWMDKHWGIHLGVPELDAIGKRAADARKHYGGILSNWREKVSGAAGRTTQNFHGLIQNPGGTTRDEVGRWAEQGKKLFGS